MPKVFIPSLLRSLTKGESEVIVSGSTVLDVIDSLDGQYPGFKERICPGGVLKPGLMIAVGQTYSQQGLRESVDDDAEVHILPAIGGG
ncbi:MAG: MoaD/ThiS family protein [Planctomycetes bacterium]|nr:MoaD/ThiS family protein [Planctomycetota bacterium]